jgi:GH15 family glucan-1,4-alpha-glucosidase
MKPASATTPCPIEDYALIGDTRTAALVAPDGALDWMCVPNFDGQPLFGRLVGGPDAGTFIAGPVAPAPIVARHYRPDTTTVETTWRTPSGGLTLTEGMVGTVTGQLLPATLLVRRLTAHDGPVEATVTFDPRLGKHHARPRMERRQGALVCSWPRLAVAVHSSPDLHLEPGRRTTMTVTPDRPVTLAVIVAHREPLIHVGPDRAWTALQVDERQWQEWCRGLEDLPYRDTAVRSLLTLELLTFSPSGAPVAAPTTSLPEDIGGIRNWDYRYAWPRDASIGIGAFLGAGKPDEARRFIAWLLHASRLERPRLPVLLTLYGRHSRSEREWSEWPGYRASRPVRAGNEAAVQHQLDVYGWVLDAAWLLTDAGHRLYGETWRAMRGFANEVVRRWREPDAGIWEVRGPGAHHVHSKLMAWLALDRALRIAATRRTPDRDVRAWVGAREQLANEVRVRGFDETRHTYTRAYGSTDVDAALLVLPQLCIEPAGSPRIRGTIDAIREQLSAGGPLLYRYPPGRDGLPGIEGAFLPCSFWLAQALAASGRLDEAHEVFGALVERGSGLGLYAEEMDPATGAHLGNFPQALTHAAVVQAALALREAAATECSSVATAL